ncbi:MAG: hypothetical protein HY906_18955 [Deltaproteobacteria bacterium]|nr:hypothetical protein [Deltaproteobacteria bacterium]
MATPPSGPEQTKRLIDLLVLVLSSSDVGKTLKPEAIRQLVQSRFREDYDGTTLDLGPLWTALLAEPDSSEFKLAPAFLQFKEYEARLATTVTMPKPLASLDRTQAKRHLVRLAVKASDLDPLLYPTLPSAPVAPPPPAAKPVAEAAAAPAPAPAAEAPALSSRRKAVVAACAVALVLALAFIGLTLFSRPGATYATARLEAILKVENARRVGHSVTGVLADGRWEEMSAADRQQALERLLKAVEPDGIRAVILRDAAGNSRAVASSVGGDRVFRVE